MQYASIRKALHFLLPTPLHPQWLSFLEVAKTCTWAGEAASGITLDIGCAGSRIRPYLKDTCRYIGLDYYPTAKFLYGKKPHIYGDARTLPIQTACIESVILFDVLEHLPRPEHCITEIWRVLKEEGKLILQVPFLYPLHDEPFDFQRLTIHGLEDLLVRNGFSVEEAVPVGKPLATAALLANLALSKTLIQWFSRKNPLALLGIFSPIFILTTNLVAWSLNRTAPTSSLMPHSYRLLCVKRGEKR